MHVWQFAKLVALKPKCGGGRVKKFFWSKGRAWPISPEELAGGGECCQCRAICIAWLLARLLALSVSLTYISWSVRLSPYTYAWSWEEASGIQGTEWLDSIRGGVYEKWGGQKGGSGSAVPHPRTSPAISAFVHWRILNFNHSVWLNVVVILCLSLWCMNDYVWMM